MLDMIRLGRQLRTLRARAGISQRVAAARAGLSFQYVSACELGKQENPTIPTLFALVDALGGELVVEARERSATASEADELRALLDRAPSEARSAALTLLRLSVRELSDEKISA